jgi:hypothetical protein
LVTPGNLFLEKVFEAMPLVDLLVVKVPKDGAAPPPAPTSFASSSAPAGESAAPVMVYHRKVPDTLPTGPVFVIEPERSSALWQLGESLHNPVVAKQDKESPLMLHIRLDNVVMPEARKLAPQAQAHVLAESAAGDPLYAVLDRPLGPGQAKVVVLTVDLDKSDLPLQTAFPIMATNLLNWFGGTKGELREAIAAGGTAVVDLGTKLLPASELVLRNPDRLDQRLLVPAGATKITVGPLDRTGIWEVQSGPVDAIKIKDESKATHPVAPVAELACNLADRRETDLRPADGLPERPQSLAAGLAVRPVWYYLLATAFVLSCWEWFLYQRRWID